MTGSGASQALHYIEPDALGTPRVVIDPQRDVAVWTWDLTGEAFDVTVPNEDPDADGTVFVLNMRYPGQRYDAASGLNYNYFRDYDTSIGRYAESDPIGLRGGMSTYSYAMNDALLYTDARGLAIWEVVDGLEIGMVIGPGGQFAIYKLKSPCSSNGLRYTIDVQVVGPSAGIGAKCKFCNSAPFKVLTGGKVDDHIAEPDPNAFNGGHLSVSLGAQLFGLHWQAAGDTLLGSATSIGGSPLAYGFGTIGAELAGTIGTSTVTNVDREPCGCKMYGGLNELDFVLKASPKLVAFSFGISVCVVVLSSLSAMIISSGTYSPDPNFFRVVFCISFPLVLILLVIRTLRKN